MASNSTRVSGETPQGGVKDLSRAKWSKQTLHVFCDLCIQFAETSKEKHAAGTATATATSRMGWKLLQLEFHKKTNLPYGKNQLKNKWDWMKGRWSLWKSFKANEPGLQWDYHKGTVAASHDWWTNKILQNIHFKAFRDEGIEPLLESKLDLLFGPSASQHALCDKDTLSSPPLSNPADDQPSENSACNHTNANIEWQELFTDHTPIPSPTPLNYSAGRPSKRLSDDDFSLETTKKRCRSSFATRVGLKMLEEKIDALAKAVTQRNINKMDFSSLDQRALGNSSHTVADSITKLVSMSGLIHGTPEFCFACTLIEDPQKRTILHGIPDDHSRLEWIKFLYRKEA